MRALIRPLAVLVLALPAAFVACLGASAPEECRCGPPRAQPEAAPAEPAAGDAHEHAAAAGPTVALTDRAGEASDAGVVPDLDGPGWTAVTSRGGRYVVHWRSLSGDVPRNRDFDMEVWVLRDGAPATEAHLSVNAWMPDHGHGMLRQPRAEARGDGSFLVEGMLLHMRGHWTLLFDVLEGTLAETAEHGIDL